MGRAATRSKTGEVVAPARIGISLPQILDHAKPGELIWFDDGKIGVYFAPWTQILQRLRSRKHVPKGKTLAPKKALTSPTPASTYRLTPEDLEALKFIVEHADLVGYSFVRTESDVRELLERLEELGGQNLGLILKIETRKAFDNLPKLILASMRTRSLASLLPAAISRSNVATSV